MSESFKNSYFYTLPNEVLIKILSDIDTLTLLNFCEVYQVDYFLQDRNVISTVNLNRCYGLEDLSQISKKICFEHVTTLNVNCLYWMQAAKLRKFVTRLINLNTLYAVQTNLSLASSDTEAFSRSKIKKLGVSVSRFDELGTHRILTVETLYINVMKVNILGSFLTLELIFPHVKKLWIDVEEPCGREALLHCLNGESKNKIFCQVKAPVPTINFGHYCLTTYYNCRRAGQPYVMCCERFNSEQLRSKSIFERGLRSWKVLEELHCSVPYGPRDARRLFLNENTLDNIFFEELNFYHIGPHCNDRNRGAIREILKSSCSSRLKKLCVMICLLENKNAGKPVNIEDSNGFSRKRIGIENSTSSHPVEEVFRNFLGLQHLEIYVCSGTSRRGVIQGYPLISLFEKLESLTLEIPVSLDGSFLIEVLKKCQRLQRLKITSENQHEKLNYNICRAISDASSLKDFRFKNQRIQLDRLIERLCLITSRKLERIVLICKEIDKFSGAPLKEFLENNPQLVFLYFVIQNSTETSLRMAQQTLNIYKKKHPSKIFFVKKSDVFNKSGYPIPDVHLSEMVNSDNKVASLCVLEDFVSF